MFILKDIDNVRVALVDRHKIVDHAMLEFVCRCKCVVVFARLIDKEICHLRAKMLIMTFLKVTTTSTYVLHCADRREPMVDVEAGEFKLETEGGG